MKVAQFREQIIPAIYRLFSYKDGLLVEGSSKKPASPKVMLCFGICSNPKFPWKPNNCLVWEGEHCALMDVDPVDHSLDITRVFTRNHVCMVRFTTVKRMERSQKLDECLCLASPEERAKCTKKCHLKAPHEVGYIARKLVKNVGEFQIEQVQNATAQ